MKSLALLSLAIGLAAAIPAEVDKRQINFAGALVGGILNAGKGKVPDPAGAAPRKVVLKPRTKVPNSESVKLRYGPYKVASMGSKNLMGEGGTLWNYPDTSVDKPCDHCTIFGMQAGLEYPDGKNANIDTGLWLHHMVLLNIGPNRRDLTCAEGGRGAPHMVVGSSPTKSERLFSSGNERTKLVLEALNVTDAGYELQKADKFALIVDLMNENMDDKTVYLTMTYDFIQGRPKGFDNIRPVWFDVAQCGTSEVSPPKQSGSFFITAPTWTANIEGEILGAGGHLHDGGQNVTLNVDGKLVCTSEATYGGKPEYVQKTPMGNKNSATSHISDMSICVGDKFGLKETKLGQKWVLKAGYNYDTNKGMLHENGRQDNIMGISIMYVRSKTT